MKFLGFAYRFVSNFVFLALVYYSLNFMEKYQQRAIVAILVLVYAAMRVSFVPFLSACRTPGARGGTSGGAHRRRPGFECVAQAGCERRQCAPPGWRNEVLYRPVVSRACDLVVHLEDRDGLSVTRFFSGPVPDAVPAHGGRARRWTVYAQPQFDHRHDETGSAACRDRSGICRGSRARNA